MFGRVVVALRNKWSKKRDSKDQPRFPSSIFFDQYKMNTDSSQTLEKKMTFDSDLKTSTAQHSRQSEQMNTSAHGILAGEPREIACEDTKDNSFVDTSKPSLTAVKAPVALPELAQSIPNADGKQASNVLATGTGDSQTTVKESKTNESIPRPKLRHLSSSYPQEINSPLDEILIDQRLAEGTPLLKVSPTKKLQRTFKIDVDQGRILWDSKKSGKVNIENIKELRIGEAARNYRENFKISSDCEPRWFTIIYVDSGKYKTLHLIAPTKELFMLWVSTLEKLYSHRRGMMGGLGHLRRRQSIWLKQNWKQADKDGNSRLNFDEVARLCRQLNINMSKELLKAKFNEADEKNDGWLNFPDFQRFVKLISRREELGDLFSFLAKTSKDTLTLEEFKNFLVNEQKLYLESEEYGELYCKFLDNDKQSMTLEGFSSFLMSSDNPIFSPEHSKLYQDMKQPLSRYFIDSSHNTYLLGNQLKGESSIEGYIRPLQRGCRCVEIDCWDGPDGPIVTHGHTLTSKILLQDAVSAINTYAFKASPYPLILSLETHCSIEQQNQMAKIFRDILGESLVTGPLKENETDLPSPEDLMYKILIKGKHIQDSDEASVSSATDTESTTDTESDADSSKDNTDVPKKKVKNKKDKPRVAKALSDLVVYCSAVKFKGFEHHREHLNFTEMSSFSERKSTKLGKAEKEPFIRHNMDHLTRVYPAGFRFTSSNYEPHNHWMFGSQMVALNWQKFDRGMQINQAMFAVNGRSGYVLKPEHLRNPNYDNTSHPVMILTIEVISAQQLPRPRDMIKGDLLNPFIEMELLVPGVEVVKRKTKVVSNNGFNPVWKEIHTFRIDYEEMGLVFLRFSIYDDNEFIASYCIPVASLQPGYRHVPLNDQNGDQFLFASLYIRSSIYNESKPLT